MLLTSTPQTDILVGNETLKGVLRTPVGAQILVVACHGYMSSSDHPTITAISSELNARGMATFSFNFTSSNPVDIPRQAADLKAIIERFRPEFADIVLLGNSFGAISAAIAARAPGVGGLITVNGFFGSGELGPRFISNYRKFRIMTQLHPAYRAIDRFHQCEFLPASINCPTFVIHSRSDEVVFQVQSTNFYDQLTCSSQFFELQDADHNISDPTDSQDIVRRIAEWIESRESNTAET